MSAPTAPSPSPRTAAAPAAGVWSLSAAPDMVWAPVAAALLVLAAGAATLVGKQPWLFASLGASAFAIAAAPRDPSSRGYNVAVGHLVAIAAGFIALALVNATEAPQLISGKAQAVSVARVWASTFAVLLAMIGQLSLRAFHAPAGATALLLALGIVRPTGKAALAMAIGIVIVALAGEGLRRARTGDRRWHPY